MKMWELHLSALNKIVPHFFTHDKLNYVHHTLYLGTMIELRTKDIDSWILIFLSLNLIYRFVS